MFIEYKIFIVENSYKTYSYENTCTIKANVVRGHSYEIFQHENVAYESEKFQIYGSSIVHAEIFARRKFSLILLSIGEIFIAQIFCPVLMITLRIWQPLLHWRKFISPNISAIQR